jgi:hypothetical protein
MGKSDHGDGPGWYARQTGVYTDCAGGALPAMRASDLRLPLQGLIRLGTVRQLMLKPAFVLPHLAANL